MINLANSIVLILLLTRSFIEVECYSINFLNGRYTLEYFISSTGFISFSAKAKTSGWVGLGINSQCTMKNAQFVVGGVLSSQQTNYPTSLTTRTSTSSSTVVPSTVSSSPEQSSTYYNSLITDEFTFSTEISSSSASSDVTSSTSSNTIDPTKITDPGTTEHSSTHYISTSLITESSTSSDVTSSNTIDPTSSAITDSSSTNSPTDSSTSLVTSTEIPTSSNTDKSTSSETVTTDDGGPETEGTLETESTTPLFSNQNKLFQSSSYQHTFIGNGNTGLGDEVPLDSWTFVEATEEYENGTTIKWKRNVKTYEDHDTQINAYTDICIFGIFSESDFVSGSQAVPNMEIRKINLYFPSSSSEAKTFSNFLLLIYLVVCLYLQ